MGSSRTPWLLFRQPGSFVFQRSSHNLTSHGPYGACWNLIKGQGKYIGGLHATQLDRKVPAGKRVFTTVQLMESSRNHPNSFSRMPALGAMTDSHLSSRLGIWCYWQEGTQWLNGWCQQWQFEPAYFEWSSKKDPIETLSGYCQSRMLMDVLLKRKYTETEQHPAHMAINIPVIEIYVNWEAGQVHNNSIKDPLVPIAKLPRHIIVEPGKDNYNIGILKQKFPFLRYGVRPNPKGEPWWFSVNGPSKLAYPRKLDDICVLVSLSVSTDFHSN